MKEFFQAITKDHDEVKDLLKKLTESSDGAVKTREKLFLKLKQEIVPHLKAEEAVFYPALMDNKEGRKHSLEAIEEHGLTEMVLNQIESLPVDDEVWSAKLKVLKDLVEHHIEEEEDEIFEIAEEEIDKEDFKQIMQAFQKEKEKVKKKIT
ncbi:MAG: hemerythrin domain-containing protein [Desulforhopalus sp.]